MEGYSNKKVDYNMNNSTNIGDVVSTNSNVYSTEINSNNVDTETIDLSEFGGSIENDPYNVIDSGFSLDEVKGSFNEVKSVNMVDDDEII